MSKGAVGHKCFSMELVATSHRAQPMVTFTTRSESQCKKVRPLLLTKWKMEWDRTRERTCPHSPTYLAEVEGRYGEVRWRISVSALVGLWWLPWEVWFYIQVWIFPLSLLGSYNEYSLVLHCLLTISNVVCFISMYG